MPLQLIERKDIETKIQEFLLDEQTINISDLGLEVFNEENPKKICLKTTNSDFKITANSERQAIHLAGIPYGFFKRSPFNLQKDMFQYWKTVRGFENLDVIMKSKENNIYALMTQDSCISNKELIEELNKTKIFNKFDMFQLAIDPNRFDIRAMFGDISKGRTLGENFPGIHIQNSETGMRRGLQVYPVVFRVSCTNGMIIPKRTLGEGFKIPSFNTYGQIKRLLNDTIIKCTKFSLDKKVEFENLRNIRIEKPIEVIRIICQENNIKPYIEEVICKNLMSESEQEYSNTQYGIINAFTSAAKMFEKDIDQRIKLEKFSQKVMDKRLTNLLQ